MIWKRQWPNRGAHPACAQNENQETQSGWPISHSEIGMCTSRRDKSRYHYNLLCGWLIK